ncbi:MAG: glycosyltransferase family 87 protein [Chloroflexota bacterium]
MTASGPRRWDLAAVIAAAVGAAVLVAAAVLFVNSRGFGYDFAAYHAAALRLLDGAPLYLPDTAARYAAGAYEGLYLYPPPLAIAMTPLALLPLDGATTAWMILRIGMLAAGCAILPVAPRVRLLTFAVACVSHAVLFDLNLGNVSLVTFVLATVAWRAMDTPLAAVAHAALVAIRAPFAVVFLGWTARGSGRAIAWTIIAGLVMIALTIPVVGVDGYLEYIAILRGLPDITTGPHNLSLRTTGSAAGLPADLAALLVPAGYLAGAIAIVFAARRRDADVSFVVTVLATLVIAPFIHPHYLVLLLLPTALLLDRGHAWALAIPLAGWLPGTMLPVIAPVVIGLLIVLVPPRERGRAGRLGTPGTVSAMPS